MKASKGVHGYIIDGGASIGSPGFDWTFFKFTKEGILHPLEENKGITLKYLLKGTSGDCGVKFGIGIPVGAIAVAFGAPAPVAGLTASTPVRECRKHLHRWHNKRKWAYNNDQRHKKLPEVQVQDGMVQLMLSGNSDGLLHKERLKAFNFLFFCWRKEKYRGWELQPLSASSSNLIPSSRYSLAFSSLLASLKILIIGSVPLALTRTQPSSKIILVPSVVSIL